jgi:TolB-like protein
MPFANIGDNQENEFLSDGLTEELIDSLAQVPGLQVVARGRPGFKSRQPDQLIPRSVIQFRNPEEHLAQP